MVFWDGLQEEKSRGRGAWKNGALWWWGGGMSEGTWWASSLMWSTSRVPATEHPR